MRAVPVALVGSAMATSCALAGPLAGKYEGKTPSGKLYVTVRKLSADKYSVDLLTYGRGDGPCVGQMSAAGALRGKVLEEAPPKPGEPEFCPLKITLDGKTVSVVETGLRCDARGAMCSFNGTVRKVK